MSLNNSQLQNETAIAAETEAWPLATNAILRVLAWPKYDDAESVKRVLTVAEPLFDNQKGCLCLRHDEEHDVPYDQAVRALETAFEDMGLTGDLEVLFINEAIAETDWPRLGRAVTAMIQVDAVLEPHRRRFVSALAGADVEIIGLDAV